MKRFSQLRSVWQGKRQFEQGRVGAILMQGDAPTPPPNPYPDCTMFQIVADGSRFTYSSSKKYGYFTVSSLKSIKDRDVVHAECTHFAWNTIGLRDYLNSGEFTCESGGKLAFRDEVLFTSRDNMMAWFKEQYANGTPVTVTLYVKNV